MESCTIGRRKHLACVTVGKLTPIRQEVLGRLLDSVVGSYKADFLEKTEGNADLCASSQFLSRSCEYGLPCVAGCSHAVNPCHHMTITIDATLHTALVG